MAELRASPVVNPSYKRIADVLANLQGPMGQIIPFTDANPFKFLMPAASTFENLAYGNSPLSEYAGVTNRRLPIVKTGREGELTDIADVALMASGLPMASRGVARGANYLGDVLTQATRAAPPAAPMRAVSEIAEAAPITPKPLPPEPVRSDIGFYSQLEAATNPLQDKGTGDQFLSQLQKSAGVKPDEIKYTGLDEFLKGKKAVTKAEIQGYLASNKVDVQEVRLGGTLPEVGVNPDSPYAIPEVLDVFQREGNAGEGFRVSLVNDYDAYMALERQFPDLLEQDEWADVVASSLFPNRQQVTPTKFSSYTLPGGENYREILLTLPNAKGALSAEEKLRMEFLRHRKTSGAYDMMKGEKVDELAGLEKRYKGTEYKSTHFDQPNVLAHMRVNDRVVDGKKTLFIEEIQSDWHQAGRKKGYKSEIDPNENASLVKQYDSLTAERRQIEGIVATGDDASPVTQNAIQKLNQINAELERVSDRLSEIRTAATEGVPDAPFKTSWHELSLKRAIQEASEKGYDQIAFTTGKTQVERYPEELRRVADEISWHSMDGKERSVIVRKEGKTVFGATLDENGIIKQSLSKEAVGKPIDEVIGKPMGGEVINKTSGEIKGKDFTVGGKGMEGFYDQILPKSLEKLGKKFDAKVGKTQMDGVEVWQMDITPKMRESVTTKGQPLFSISGLGAGAIGSGFYQDDTMEQLSR
jgi:hypothetical protein